MGKTSQKRQALPRRRLEQQQIHNLPRASQPRVRDLPPQQQQLHQQLHQKALPRLRLRALDPLGLTLLLNQNRRPPQTLHPQLERHVRSMLRQVQAKLRDEPIPKSPRQTAQMLHRLARQHPDLVH